MSLAANVKKRKLFQVAKELKLATNTLVEVLEENGIEVAKKQMTPVDEDMYRLLLQRFAPERWAEMKEEAAREESLRSSEAAQHARQEELRKILETDAPKPAKPAPSVRKHDPSSVPPREAPVAKEPVTAASEEAHAVETEPKAPATGETRAAAPPKRRRTSVRGEARDIPAEEKPAEPVAEAPAQTAAPRRTRVSTPSVRGGVSNDDILPLSTSSVTPEVDDVKLRPAPSREKPAKVEADEDEQKARRKRRRKPTKNATPTETHKPGGGAVSTSDAPARKRRRRKDKKKKPDATEVAAQVKQTLAAMETGTAKKKRKRKVRPEIGVVDEDQNLLKITEFISTTDLANLMDVPVS